MLKKNLSMIMVVLLTLLLIIVVIWWFDKRIKKLGRDSAKPSSANTIYIDNI